MRSTFAVRETASLGIMLRALSTLRGLRGAPEVPPLCRETQSLGQQMLNAPVGISLRGVHTMLLKPIGITMLLRGSGVPSIETP